MSGGYKAMNRDDSEEEAKSSDASNLLEFLKTK